MNARTKIGFVGVVVGAICFVNLQPTAVAAPRRPSLPMLNEDSTPDSANPYEVIVDRNVFHLNTPPAPPAAETAPPPDIPKVTISGFRTVGDKVIVNFAVHTGDGAAQKTAWYTMSPGEIAGPIQLVKVDLANESVDIINSGNAMTLSKKKDGYAESGGGGGPAGRAGPGGRSRLIPAPPTPTPAPTTFDDSGNGGTIIGGSADAQPKPFSVGRPNATDPYAGNPFVGGASGYSTGTAGTTLMNQENNGGSASRFLTGGASEVSPAAGPAGNSGQPALNMNGLIGARLTALPPNSTPIPAGPPTEGPPLPGAEEQ